MKKGFTLVELSIVLVIIGLLIGGILVAQSMINTTKVNKQISQLSSYDVAITNFRQRFKTFPGDAGQFTNPGDGNGYTDSNSESTYVWAHLAEGSGFRDTSTTRPYNNPLFVLADQKLSPGCCTVFFQYNIIGSANVHWYWQAGSWDAFTVPDIVALEAKLDDSNPATGAIQDSAATCTTAGAYDMTMTGFTCAPYFRYGLTSGITEY